MLHSTYFEQQKGLGRLGQFHCLQLQTVVWALKSRMFVFESISTYVSSG